MLMKPIIIIGKMGSGKTTVAEHLCRVYSTKAVHYDRVATTTTRKRRPNEPLNAYNFVSDSEFNQMIGNGEFIEHVKKTNADGSITQYGSKWSNYEAYTDFNDVVHIKVSIIEPKGLKEVLRYLGSRNVTVVYLKCSKKTLVERLKGRGTESDAEIEKRLADEEKSFKNIEPYADLKITCDRTNIGTIANIIDQYEHGTLY